MRFQIVFASAVLASMLALSFAGAAEEENPAIAGRLLREALASLEKGDRESALKFATRAIERDSKFARARFVRGMLHEDAARHEEAVEDFTKAIELDAKLAEAYDHRGSEQFKLGKIDESTADFDKFVELEPAREREHWKRGISYYYAGRYADGAKQFEGYQTFDKNDVENAVWRFMCMARTETAKVAQKALLPIEDDKRVPMMEVYKLFQGKLEPAAVLEVATAKPPNEEALNRRLFYAHLYVGLYYEAVEKPVQAREHLEKAARDHKIEHYMWDVARVHAARLKEAAQPAKEETTENPKP